MSNEAEQTEPTASPTPEPAAAAPAPAEGESSASLMDRLAPVLDHAPPEAQEFVRKNGVTVLIAVGTAVLVYVGASMYRNFKTSQAADAERKLFGQGTEQVQEVVDQYGSTPVAPLAQLTLASARYDEGQYEVARTLYTQFIAQHPDHPMRAQAELNASICQEAAGLFEDALAGFVAMGEKDKQGYLYAETQFGRARCLEQLGRFDEAKAVYDDFIAGHPDSAWTDRAEAAKLYIDKEKRAAANPQAASAGLPFQFNPFSKPAAPAGLPAPVPAPAPQPPAPSPSPAPAP